MSPTRHARAIPTDVHASSAVRIITNPPIAVKEPFRFDLPAEQLSLVERKTLAALGKDRLGFTPTRPRAQVVPERVKIQQRLMEEEKAREQAKAQAQAPPVAPQSVAVA
jgi:hypothetical protein